MVFRYRGVSFMRVWGVAGTLATAAGAALAQDPLASNNGLYPTADEWDGRFLAANLGYPTPASNDILLAANSWSPARDRTPLQLDTAAAYADRLLDHLAQTLRPLVDQPAEWDPVAAGWYDLVWSGDGTKGPDGIDPTSGREALMNTYSGQIVPPETFSEPYQPTVPVQNHAVIYYNHVAAGMLGRLWSNIYLPDLSETEFPTGSIVVKVEAVTNNEDNWNVVANSGFWQVFRPTTEDQASGKRNLVPQVIPARPFQIAVRVKDPVAAPETGWVFAIYVHDAGAEGDTPWDRFVPVGLQWGNDPDQARNFLELTGTETLQQSWINPAAPAFARDTLGWEGRLAGPMDVATRHNVITVSGTRYTGDNSLPASSCQSCHGAAEYPFTANLYPSPNRVLPRDGQPFLLYDPGSPDWARWFQNRPGTEAMSANIGGKGLDYDLALMNALSVHAEAVGNEAFTQGRLHVH
ncbi:hypothetical protein SAMN04489859_1003130 [Paracoccus alcaliphilus]|uniref:Cytochrome c domain-containing protein n=1 Tax=Paracoccus alcaliphilus TaxID=34002 RepID=A0A1H8F4T1_9RHOB|nr:hypothetical protein [Paracoccus alcaliphilus]WCR20388.1 hypothetical protein JHW40_19190 [Paracoccus alcaliphilus]SEN26078.1 hypothetical protein SAMN04489859_1003130 [Paracoccus alcaliphilus]